MLTLVPSFRQVIIDPGFPGGDCRAIGDMNGDAKPDILAASKVELAWYEYSSWRKHPIARPREEFTTDMQVADVDGDGRLDIVVNERRGMRRLQIWENVNHGASWREHLIDAGKEGHLGARVTDIDGDGQSEILSIAWDTHPYLRLWRRSR